jgi:hypothetical protein
MQVSRREDRQRWVVKCDPLTVAVIKSLAATGHYSMGYVLDMCVEYFGRKVHFDKDKPLQWYPPDDF